MAELPPDCPVIVRHRCACGGLTDLLPGEAFRSRTEPGDVAICMLCARAFVAGKADQLFPLDVDQLDSALRSQIQAVQAGIRSDRSTR
jgi:hypothetical protein